MKSGKRRSPDKGHFHAACRISVAFSLLVACHAAADDAPARKAGLWEVKTSIEGHAVTVKQCIDASTDQMLQSSTGPLAAQACPSRQVNKSGSGVTIESRCSFNGKPASARAVVTGSFDSAYTMTVTAEGKDLPATKMTMEGKWLGACAADQRPGDVIMSNGVKVNVPDLQQRALAPDAATPSAK